MPVDSRRELLKSVRNRKYLNKDFQGFRADLLEYARVHYPDKIRDFSETGLGGLLLDFPSYVGDVNSFYMDHQFHELDIETAVEERNIERHIRAAGVPITGAAPAVVMITFTIMVPATTSSPKIPDTTALPIIYAGTTVQAENGIQFELTEDIDFTEVDNAGNLLGTVAIVSTDINNEPETFQLSRQEICISGFRTSETFSLGSFEAFKKVSLSNENITEVISVRDGLGNEYYEVEHLTQDTVFKSMLNRNEDNQLVKDNLTLIPAPYRFTRTASVQTRLTTLTFGGGNAETLDDDIVPDPSEFALPLYGKRTFSRFTLNPGNLLQTTTLGVISQNTSLTIEYRYGGGLDHNIGPRSIRGVLTLRMSFPNNPSPGVSAFVRASTDATNATEAAGGDDPPTLDELKQRVPAIRNSQARIVSKEDIIARVYTLPSNFGRVFRASIRSNPNNPNAARLFIISRNANQQLAISPDSLKKNLALYLNQFRLISDALDILDAQVINLKLEFTIVADPAYNKNLVLQNVLARLKQYFGIKNFEIDQPIVIDDIKNIIYNNIGVIAIQSVKIKNICNTVGDRVYSDVQFDVSSNTTKNIIIGPPGSLFELKFKDYDLQGVVI